MLWSTSVNMCFLPAKQCYNCQGVGHVQADCPTLRLNGGTSGRCYNCNQLGHLAVRLSRYNGVKDCKYEMTDMSL
jgi:hypothetical protein